MIKGLKHFSYGKRHSWDCSPSRIGDWGDWGRSDWCVYISDEGSKENRAGLFLAAASEKARGNGHIVKYKTFHLKNKGFLSCFLVWG